jgi:hypothetical protein
VFVENVPDSWSRKWFWKNLIDRVLADESNGIAGGSGPPFNFRVHKPWVRYSVAFYKRKAPGFRNRLSLQRKKRLDDRGFQVEFSPNWVIL